MTRTQNRPLLLARAICSVMQQTLADLQMVIVNDGGDRSVVEAVVEGHRHQSRGRLSVVHHDRATGMEAATNTGLHASDSCYVAILDDDDTWHPRFLERTVETLESTGAMGVVTATEAVYEDIDYGDIRQFDSFLFDPMADVAPRQPSGAPRRTVPPTTLFQMLSGNQFPPCSFVYRRRALAEVGEYDESLPVLGDWDFNIRFLLHFDVEFLDCTLAYYHHRKGQSGELDNSVGHGEELHDRIRGELLNRYLREDLQRGSLGIGVLANLLHDLRSQRAADLASAEGLSTEVHALRESVVDLNRKIEAMTAIGSVDPPTGGRSAPVATVVPSRPVAERMRRMLARPLGRDATSTAAGATGHGPVT